MTVKFSGITCPDCGFNKVSVEMSEDPGHRIQEYSFHCSMCEYYIDLRTYLQNIRRKYSSPEIILDGICLSIYVKEKEDLKKAASAILDITSQTKSFFDKVVLFVPADSNLVINDTVCPICNGSIYKSNVRGMMCQCSHYCINPKVFFEVFLRENGYRLNSISDHNSFQFSIKSDQPSMPIASVLFRALSTNPIRPKKDVLLVSQTNGIVYYQKFVETIKQLENLYKVVIKNE